jgi:hypothetical protein
MKGGSMAKSSNIIGSYAFLIGLVLAVIVGLIGSMFDASTNVVLAYVLVIAGLIVGFLNVTGDETMPFLLSGAVLIIASSLGGSAFIGVAYLPSILGALLMLFVPATIVVAIKNVFNIARN